MSLMSLMSQILDMLRPGDILTHCYSGAPNLAGQFTNIVQEGTLQVGAPADLSLFDWVEGAVSFVDTRNNKREGKGFLRPAGTVAGGVAFGRPYQSPFSPR